MGSKEDLRIGSLGQPLNTSGKDIDYPNIC